MASELCGSNLDGKPYFYQKHMTQHMVPQVPRDWMHEVRNVFLIRHPARVIASYAAKREAPSLLDIGFMQQLELFEEVEAWGGDPLVIDSHDIRADPATMLGALCERLGIAFSDAMLSWPSGGRPEDGVWASHWYEAVWRSTGFAGPEGALPELTGPYAVLCDQAMPAYDALRSRAMLPQ